MIEEEEDSLYGASKRRQLFQYTDTKQIYHIKNQQTPSQGLLSYNSQIKLDDSLFTREEIYQDNTNKNLSEENNSSINVKDLIQTTHSELIKQSTYKRQIYKQNKQREKSFGNILEIPNKKDTFEKDQDNSSQQYFDDQDDSVKVELEIVEQQNNNNNNVNNIKDNLRLSTDIKQDQLSKWFLKSDKQQQSQQNQQDSSNNNGNSLAVELEEIKEIEEKEDMHFSYKRQQTKKSTFKEVWCRLGSVLFNVKKFVRVLKSKSSYFKFRVLMNHHSLYIIGDVSSYYKNDTINSTDYYNQQSSSQQQNEKSCIMRFSEPFSPDEALVLIWETYLTIIIILEMFLIPIRVCFKESLQMDHELFNDIPIISYVLEILLNLNMGYFDQGNLIIKRKLIIKNYLSKYFFIDFFCLFTSIFSRIIFEFQIIGIIALFVRINKVHRLSSRIDDSFQLQFKYPEANELLRLLMTIIFIAHVTGCGFHYVGFFVSPEEKNWLTKIGIYSASSIERYLNCLYYAFITMVTVGYGDIVPVSKIEKVYVMCMTLISCGVFAYAVNTIGSIFRDLTKKQFNFKQYYLFQTLQNQNLIEFK